MGGGKASLLREVNLEAGLPYVDQAIKRLTFEIHHSRKLGCTALKIIHGYGSSGTGGRIRTESRKYLARLKGQGTIRDFLPERSSLSLRRTPAGPLPGATTCAGTGIWTGTTTG